MHPVFCRKMENNNNSVVTVHSNLVSTYAIKTYKIQCNRTLKCTVSASVVVLKWESSLFVIVIFVLYTNKQCFRVQAFP